MAQTIAFRPTLWDNDDDDISVTSSVSEAYNSDKEFDVDRVLAERGLKNNKYYLISWLDYPIEKATWEPARNVGGNILERWHKRMQLEKDGAEQPFDISSWEAQVKRQQDEKADRHRRREAKRKRLTKAKLGDRKAKNPSDNDSSSEPIEENEIENAPGMRTKGVAKRKKVNMPAKKNAVKVIRREDSQGNDDNWSDLEAKIKETPKRKRRTTAVSIQTPEKSKPLQRSSDPDLEQAPLAAFDQQKSKIKKTSSSTGPPVQWGSAVPQVSSVAASSPASARSPMTTRISMTVRPLPSNNNEVGGDTTNRPRGGVSTRAGKSATRGGSNVIHKNVFEAREPAKQRGSLLKNATDATKDPKSFGKISFIRKAELQARDIAERAPDISVLGGLFDPSKPASMQPIRPSGARKSSSNAVNQEEPGIDLIPNDLFVSKVGSPSPEPPVSAISSTPVVSQQQRSLRPLVCFFWDRWNKDNRQPPCSRGTSCNYDHTDHYGQPVAAPPDNFVPHRPDLYPPTLKQTDPFIGDATHSPPDFHPVASSSFNQQERSSRTPLVCFFWDRWKKNNAYPRCGRWPACMYDHTYEYGQPVASPPPGYVFRDPDVSNPPPRQTDSSMSGNIDLPPESHPVASSTSNEEPPPNPKHLVCAYWDAEQRDSSIYPPCKLGAACNHLHTYVGGFQIEKLRSYPATLSGSSEPRRSNRKKYVCQWWDAEQRDSSKNLPCKLGTACPDLHTYDGDFPIAGPVCFFWDQAQKSSANPSCRQGDRCKYQHDYRDGAPVAPPPPGWIPTNEYMPPSQMAGPSVSDNSRPAQSATLLPRGRNNSIGEEPISKELQVAVTENRTCYFWDRAQRDPSQRPCTKGMHCEFLHASLPTVPVAVNPRPQSPDGSAKPVNFPTRPPWNPQNPLHAICNYWFYDLGCKKGNSCNYYHSSEANLPILPSPTCKFWAEGYCDKSAEDCPFLHGYSTSDLTPSRGATSSDYRPQAKVSAPTAPRKSVKFALDDDSMLFTDEPESMSSDNQAVSRNQDQDKHRLARKVCQHFLRGDCRHGHRCPDLHDTSANRDPLPFNRLERDSRAPNGAKKSTADEDVEMLRFEVSSLDIAKHPSNAQSAPILKVKRKTKMDDYKNKKTLGMLGARAKEVSFGSDNTQSVVLDFGDVGLPNQDAWKEVFTSTSKIVFDRLCMAEDLRVQQGFLRRCALWNGSLTDPADMDMAIFIGQVVDELVIRAAGVVSMFPEFAILLFPSKREEWKFLEPADYPTEARLRYLIFRHDINPQLYQDPSSNLQWGGPYRKTLMDKIHGLRLEKLLPVCLEGQNPFKFFLLFPRSQQQDADFFAAWIRASHPESQIYDSRSEGSWNFFVKSNDGFGVVLIHEAITSSIYKLPSLSRLINKYSNVAIWNVSDPSSAFPALPSTSLDPGFGLGQVRLTRLFPHGCAFLLTPSLLAAEPELSYEILKWFLTGPKPKCSSVTPGTWKLVSCHGLTDYVLDLANSKATEKENFEFEHKDEPAKDSMLNEKKLSFNHCEIRYRIHKALVSWEMKQPLDSDSNSDFNDNIEHPRVEAPESIDPDDEERLINWFSGWAMLKMDLYRKFGIIGTNSSNVARASRLKEVVAQKSSSESENSFTKFKAFSMANPGTQHPVQPLGLRTDDSDDVSMDVDSPMSTKHGTNVHQTDDVLSFVALTGTNLDVAKEFLARAKSDLNRAVALYKTEGSSIEDQIVELISSDTSRHLPRLDAGQSDLQRAEELRASPSPPRRPSVVLSDITNKKRAGQGSSQFDRSSDLVSPQYEVGALSPEEASKVWSRKHSLVGSPDSMSLASYEHEGCGSERASKRGRWEEVVAKAEPTVMQMKDFKATSSWYRSLSEAGNGWEHVTVLTDWISIRQFLGMK